MSKRALQTLPPPATRAVIFICQKCGKRVGGPYKEASHELASDLKHAARREFGKKDVRIVLTGCMKVCPPDRITVCVQMQGAQGHATFLEADIENLEGAGAALLRRLKDGR